MSSIPTDPVGAIIWAINLALTGISAAEAFGRLASGITAKAEAEGRDVTEDEQALINGVLEAAEKRRRGQ